MDDEQRKNKIISIIKNHEIITSNKKKITISTRIVAILVLVILIISVFGLYEFFSKRTLINDLEFKVTELELKLKKYLKENGTDVEDYKTEFVKLNYKTKRISNQEIRVRAMLDNEGNSDLSSVKLVALCFLNNHLERSQIIDMGPIEKNQNKQFDFKINCMAQRQYIFVSEIEFTAPLPQENPLKDYYKDADILKNSEEK